MSVEFKTLISTLAVILSLAAYIPYLKDIFKGKTKPHIYSWFIWGIVTAVAYGLQISAGAGVGSWVTLTVAIVAFIIFFLGMRSGIKDITFFDTIFFILALVAIYLWLVVKQPVESVILVSSIDMLGFIPTVRKSWNKPHSETLFTYKLSTFRHGLSILALQKYSIVTWLYPLTWAIANGLFSIMLIYRRRKLES
jgi:hypothetical protein